MRKALTLLVLLVVTTFVSPLFGGDSKEWAWTPTKENVLAGDIRSEPSKSEKKVKTSRAKKGRTVVSPVEEEIPTQLPIGITNNTAAMLRYRLDRVNDWQGGFARRIGTNTWEGRMSWGSYGQFPKGKKFSSIGELNTERNLLFAQYEANLLAWVRDNPNEAGSEFSWSTYMSEIHIYEDGSYELKPHFIEQIEFFIDENGQIPQSVKDSGLQEHPKLWIHTGGAEWIYDRVESKPGIENQNASVWTYGEPNGTCRIFEAPWIVPDDATLYGRINIGGGKFIPATGWITLMYMGSDGQPSFAKFGKGEKNGVRERLNPGKLYYVIPSGEIVTVIGTAEQSVEVIIESAPTLDGPWEFAGSRLTYLSTGVFYEEDFSEATSHRFYRFRYEEAPNGPWLKP